MKLRVRLSDRRELHLDGVVELLGLTDEADPILLAQDDHGSVTVSTANDQNFADDLRRICGLTAARLMRLR